MKKINLEIDLSDKELLFNLASIGFTELLKYEDILIEKDIRGRSVLSYFCININSFNEEKQNTIIDYVLNLENLEKHNNPVGDSLFHILALRCRVEIMQSKLCYSLKNNCDLNPYYYLIKSIPKVRLKDCINISEILKPLKYLKYTPPIMVLDAFLERNKKLTFKEMNELGISLNTDKSKNNRKLVSYEDILNFKKNNSLMYILS